MNRRREFADDMQSLHLDYHRVSKQVVCLWCTCFDDLEKMEW